MEWKLGRVKCRNIPKDKRYTVLDKNITRFIQYNTVLSEPTVILSYNFRKTFYPISPYFTFQI